MTSDPELAHLAIIMDGNRRWAALNGQSLASTLRMTPATIVPKLFSLCERLRITYLTLFAFSTANRQRSEGDQAAVLRALGEFADEFPFRFPDYSLRFIGRQDAILQSLKQCEVAKANASLHVTIAVDYSSRADLVAAVNALNSGRNDSVTFEDVCRALSTRDLSEPDVLVRYGGKRRLSDFLLIEAAYTELVFLSTLWPDFSESELEAHLRNWKPECRPYGT